MSSTSGLLHLINVKRTPESRHTKAVRVVYRSELLESGSEYSLSEYMQDRVPLFYQTPDNIASRLKDGYFLTAFREALAKLPNSKSHQTSHFGEIVAAVFAEEVLNLRRLYSKLTLLTAENSNAYKMDLVLYDPSKDPYELVLAEVKCSPQVKSAPAKKVTKKATTRGAKTKKRSCYVSIFDSLNKYQDDDRRYDLAAAHARLDDLPDEDREPVRRALMPYSTSPVRYAAFAVIDKSTYCSKEASLLQTRKNKKSFEVDIVCVERFRTTAHSVFKKLKTTSA